MANTIQFKRGLEADRTSVTPAAGEILYTTDDKKVYIGDGSTAGGNIVSAAGGAAIEATASGALANGDLVVVNSDGTVSVVAQSSVTEAVGTPVVFEAATTYYTATAYDSVNDKVVIAYRDAGNSNYGTAIVGTVSGTSITFGAPVVFETGSANYIAATYDSDNGKIVIAYQDAGNSGYGTAIVGTVSGTSISFGTPAVFRSSYIVYTSMTYTKDSKVFIAYADQTSSNYAQGVVGTVSGTSISFGSYVQFYDLTTYYTACAYDSANDKVVTAIYDGWNGLGRAYVMTISGTSFTYGSPSTFVSSAPQYIGAAYDSDNGKTVLAYSGASNYGTATVATVSGTSISFGTAVVFESAATFNIFAAYDSGSQKVNIAYRDLGNLNYGTVTVGTVSGTAISFGTPSVFESGNINYISMTYDSNSIEMVIAYQARDNLNYGTAVVFRNAGLRANLTATNYIGISDGAYADTATATIQTAGAIDDAQTGLTAGSTYYVQKDGTLSTTADTPSVVAGTAVSSTSILVKG